MEPLLQGMLFGLGLSILAGPILFTLLHLSLERGVQAGLLAGIGIWLTDFGFILLTYFGLSSLDPWLTDPSVKKWMGIVGSVFLALFGLILLLRKRKKGLKKVGISKRKEFFTYLSLGMAVNSINPFTIFFWLSVLTSIVLQADWTPGGDFLFYAGIMGVVIATDTGKVVLAAQLDRLLLPWVIQRITQVSGIIIMCFGIWYLYQSLF